MATHLAIVTLGMLLAAFLYYQTNPGIAHSLLARRLGYTGPLSEFPSAFFASRIQSKMSLEEVNMEMEGTGYSSVDYLVASMARPGPDSVLVVQRFRYRRGTRLLLSLNVEYWHGRVVGLEYNDDYLGNAAPITRDSAMQLIYSPEAPPD
ncbi:MAG: hypothetical protein AB7I33_10730 [Gemmatimonadales bacterium]